MADLTIADILRASPLGASAEPDWQLPPGALAEALRNSGLSVRAGRGAEQPDRHAMRLRVPGPIDESTGREVVFPEGRDGGKQYVELPGMRLPHPQHLAEHPGDLLDMARQLPMMMGYTAGPAGAFTAPARLYGDPGVRAAEATAKAVLEHPKVAAVAGAIPGALAATSADTGTGPGPKPVDYEPPGLWDEVKTAAARAVGKATASEERPLTADEYKDKNRKLAPKSKPDFIEGQLKATRDSPAYQDSNSPGKRNNLMNEAQANAEKLYTGYQKSVADEETRLNAAYGDYRKGWDQQRAEHLAKPFVERNPIAGTALTYGGPLAAMLMTRGAFGAINKKGAAIAAAGEEARAADNVRGLADQITKADSYRWHAPVAKAAIAAEAAALPFEARITADVGDAYGLPPDAAAAKAAHDRLSDWNAYLTKGEQSLVSGAIGTATGAGWAKWRTPSPGVDLATLRSHAAGLPKGLAPDQLAIGLAERAQGAKDAQARLRGDAPSAPAIAARTEPGALALSPPPPATLSTADVVDRLALPAPDQPRLAAKVLAKDQELQRAALPSPASSQSPLPKWAERDGYKVGLHPYNPNQTQRPDGKWGPNVDNLKRPPKGDAKQSTPEIVAREPEQTVNTPAPSAAPEAAPASRKVGKPVTIEEAPIVKEPIQIDDMAPYGRRSKPNGRHSSLSDMLRSMG